MISALLGCDNVGWGGLELGLRTPPPRDTVDVVDTASVPSFTRPMPTGPLLYAVERTASATLIHPVAEIGPARLLPLASATDTAWWAAVRSERMPVGARFRVFSDGSRVGGFSTYGGTEVMPGYCTSTLGVPGRLELVPEAAGVTRFIALSDEAGAQLPDGVFEPVEPTTADRATTRSVMGQIIPQRGLLWPSDLDAARAALHVLDLGATNPAVAATFLYRDRFTVSAPAPGAYAIFFLAISTGPNGYIADYLWHRPAEEDGKGIPTYFSHLDWDGDGDVEVLLDVLGAESRWFAVVEREGTEWRRTFEDECGARLAG